MRVFANAVPGISLLVLIVYSGGCTKGVEDTAFSDCPGCPVMVPIPAGRFAMGMAEDKQIPDPQTGKGNANELPQHAVTMAQPFAIGKYEITVEQFGAFVADSGYKPSTGCMILGKDIRRMTIDPERNWQNPGFGQAGNEPVVCVSLDDALAYVAWLSRKTGKNYFIPSEAQWEYAAKAGTDGPYFWGRDPTRACDYMNVTFPEPATPSEGDDTLCEDRYPGLAPVGSYRSNAFGVHDPIGNAWEWVMDCNHKNYIGAPADGSAWIDEENCLFRVIRGGGAGNVLDRTTNVVRAGRPKSGTAPNLGFRVARSMVEGPVVTGRPAETAPPESAAASWPVDVPGGELFATHCAACHRDPSSYKGVYGTDAASITNIIRNGGNNIMSMPAFGKVLTDAQIAELTAYLVQQKGWN